MTSLAHPGLARRLGAPPPPTAAPGYPPQYAVCGLAPACPRRTPEAPFFRGLHRLAVDDGPAGAGLAAQEPPHRGEQRVVNPRPGPSSPPNPKVVVDRKPVPGQRGTTIPPATGPSPTPDTSLTSGVLVQRNWTNRVRKPTQPGGGWWNAPWAGCPSAGRSWCATTRSHPITLVCFNWLVHLSGTAVNGASLI